MSGYVDNHPLSRDLPEFRDTIRSLKMSDAHFQKRMQAYEAIDKKIVRAEQGVENVADLELDGMKMSRVKLKDELVEMLRAVKSKI
jgi:uncharacterized protein YdcH (DUF465 family)